MMAYYQFWMSFFNGFNDGLNTKAMKVKMIRFLICCMQSHLMDDLTVLFHVNRLFRFTLPPMRW